MKYLKVLLVLALALVTVLALVACGGDKKKNCEHTYDEAITTPATCQAEGIKTFTCSQCGNQYTETIPVGDHQYTDKMERPTCTTPGLKISTCKICGASTTEEVDPAAGHQYTETVVPATCLAGGYTLIECENCDENHKENETAISDVHVYKTSVVALTDEQKAQAPGAIGMEAVTCELCGKSESTGKAVYVFMDFEEVPDLTTYEGSDSFKAIPENYRNNATTGAGLAYIDMQDNLRACQFGGNNGTGFNMKGDGKLTLATATGFMIDDLYLISKSKSALKAFTISFDITVGRTPTVEETEGKVDCRKDIFFALGDPKSNYNIRAAALMLDKTSMSDDGMEYELKVQQYSNSSTANMGNEATGFFVNLEKEYSFKLEFDYVNGTFVTIFVKETGSSEDYQNIGSYELNANHGASEYGYIFMQGSKNVVDNFKITADLGAERIPE